MLTEEIKVKDQIIKANEMINSNTNSNKEVNIPDGSEGNIAKNTMAKCTECDWTSPILSQLDGHISKHTGQYICDVCKQAFKTNSDIVKHRKVHSENQEQLDLVCITCDKSLQSDHSFKQHMLAKHKENQINLEDVSNALPVGHPERYRNTQDRSKGFA